VTGERPRVLRRRARCVQVLQRQAVLLQILQRVARTIHPRRVAQVVEVHHPGQVRLADVRAEDLLEGVLLQHRLGDGEVDRLGVVSADVGVFLGLREDELVEVELRDAQDGLALEGGVQAALEEFVVHEFTDEARGDALEAAGEEAALDGVGDLVGDVRRQVGLGLERHGDAALVPGLDLIARPGIDEQAQVGRRGRAPGALAHAHRLAHLRPPVAIEDIGLRRLGVTGLDEHLLDHVLDVLDARLVAVEVPLEEQGHGVGEFVGQRAVGPADRLGRLEDRVGDLPHLERDDPSVAFSYVGDGGHDPSTSFPTRRSPPSGVYCREPAG